MKVDYKKYADGLVPAIVQDASTGKVLMLGFMNEEALAKTQELKKVTFYSRSKNRLWTKGEESGNFLLLNDSCYILQVIIHHAHISYIVHVADIHIRPYNNCPLLVRVSFKSIKHIYIFA